MSASPRPRAGKHPRPRQRRRGQPEFLKQLAGAFASEAGGRFDAQTYNTDYNPSNNEIVLPAAIFILPGIADSLVDAAMQGESIADLGASLLGWDVFAKTGRYIEGQVVRQIANSPAAAVLEARSLRSAATFHLTDTDLPLRRVRRGP